MIRNRWCCLLLLILTALTLLFSQSQAQSDPQAVALATQAMTALTNGIPVNDVTLSGTVTWAVGSEAETGNATFLALGTTESRMDLMLPSGTRTEIRDASRGYPQGKWIAPSGLSGPYADYNCPSSELLRPAWPRGQATV